MSYLNKKNKSSNPRCVVANHLLKRQTSWDKSQLGRKADMKKKLLNFHAPRAVTLTTSWNRFFTKAKSQRSVPAESPVSAAVSTHLSKVHPQDSGKEEKALRPKVSCLRQRVVVICPITNWVVVLRTHTKQFNVNTKILVLNPIFIRFIRSFHNC